MNRPNPMDEKMPALDGLAGPAGCNTQELIMEQKTIDGNNQAAQGDTRLDLSVSADGELLVVSAVSFFGGDLVSRDSIYLTASEAQRLSVLLYQAINRKGGK